MDTWTEKDFESLSWHGNHVHGFSIAEGDDGCSGSLTFDIDFIVKWLNPVPPDKGFRFHVAPATLIFHGATDLKLVLDYPSGSCATIPFSINGIERKEKIYSNGHKSFEWTMVANFPKGEITFLAEGFTQALRSPPIESTSSFLGPDRKMSRGNAI